MASTEDRQDQFYGSDDRRSTKRRAPGVESIFILLLSLSALSGLEAQDDVRLILPTEVSDTVRLKVPETHKEEWNQKVLSIFVKNDSDNYLLNAIQGVYDLNDSYLAFRPCFPYEKELTYIVRTSKALRSSSYSYTSFRIEAEKNVEQAMVRRVFPSADLLPENVLRFYIHFNTPMKKGVALKHVQLINAAGEIDHHAFMEFKQELWSADEKRLTLLFDPGRIKRGVSTNQRLGPALLQGEQYILRISNEWKDVHGRSIETFEKEFEVVSAYRQEIDIADWQIDRPKRDSHDTLNIHFDRIMDHALPRSMLNVVNAEDDSSIAGAWVGSENERSVHFVPEKKWSRGRYEIRIGGHFEDVAGNNLHNLLDNRSENEPVIRRSELSIFFEI